MEIKKIILLGGLSALAALHFNETFASGNKNHVELLFLQEAQTGKINLIDEKKKCYELVLHGLHHRVLYFSNTPNKIAGRLTSKQLLTTLTHDQNVEKVVPNTVLNAFITENHGQREINASGTLSNAKYKANKFSYSFCLFSDSLAIKTGELREVHLFIDPIHRWPP